MAYGKNTRERDMVFVPIQTFKWCFRNKHTFLVVTKWPRYCIAKEADFDMKWKLIFHKIQITIAVSEGCNSDFKGLHVATFEKQVHWAC